MLLDASNKYSLNAGRQRIIRVSPTREVSFALIIKANSYTLLQDALVVEKVAEAAVEEQEKWRRAAGQPFECSLLLEELH